MVIEEKEIKHSYLGKELKRKETNVALICNIQLHKIFEKKMSLKNAWLWYMKTFSV